MTEEKIGFEHLTPASHGVTYRELRAAQASSALSPLFTLGGVPASVGQFYYGEQHLQPVGVFELEEVDVTSHGLIARDGRFLVSERMNMSEDAVRECALYGELSAHRTPAYSIAEPVVMLAGPGHLIWGHWIADFLPKLFVLQAAGIDIDRAQYLIPRNTPAFALQLLALLGIGEKQLISYEPYAETLHLRRLIAPTLTRCASRAHPALGEAAKFLLARIEAGNGPLVPPPNCERIFLSRRAAGRDGRMLVNREDVETWAQAAGFRIVQPEQMPLLQQIALFKGARQIIGEYGSGLHNSIFSPAGVVVCALRASAIHPGFLQSGICQAMGQAISYVFGPADAADVEQRFEIDRPDFEMALRLLQLHAADIANASPGVQVLPPAAPTPGHFAEPLRALLRRLRLKGAKAPSAGGSAAG
jgi:hypothetical protein